MSTEWIRADYIFGKRMKAIFIPGQMMDRLGVSAKDVFNPIACEDVFNKLKQFWPSDAILMRLSMAYDRDGVTFWITSQQFPRLKEGEAAEEIDIETFIESQRQ